VQKKDLTGLTLQETRVIYGEEGRLNLVLDTNAVSLASIEVIAQVVAGVVETLVPLVQVAFGNTVLLGERSAVSIGRLDGGILVAVSDNVTDSVGGSLGAGGAGLGRLLGGLGRLLGGFGRLLGRLLGGLLLVLAGETTLSVGLGGLDTIKDNSVG
jgi:hypothetical protein